MSTQLAVTSISVQPKPMLHSQSKECPHCKANLVAGVIPQESRHNYLPMVKNPETGRYEDGPDDGRELLYYRTIGMSSILFDRTLAYQCPDCQTIDVIPGCEPLWYREAQYWAKSGDQTTIPALQNK